MTGQNTLDQARRIVGARLAGPPLDHDAAATVGTLYRAAGVVRNHFERTVLFGHDLTWTGWVVLSVVWVWDDIETRHAASEAGISKSTLTGVVSTLAGRGLILRRPHPGDARRVLLSLTPPAQALMTDLLPKVNAQEAGVLGQLTAAEREVLSGALRKVVLHLEVSEPHDGPGAVTART